ncbi:MAG: type II toxin-antitoxin system VapC family toxin [Oscillatoria sp. SIO1A7]|nr:type II toxin-antitoxin system VapC family toxin [Oscillatoria sp. SIO1A7]
MSYILDTNIVTAILKRNEKIQARLDRAYQNNRELFISGITYYEIKRGLLATNATRQLADFERLCRSYRVVSVLNEIEILERAATIHAELKRRGTPLEDADILIAATAIVQGLILVSHDSDMLRVPGVTVEDWLL